MTKSGRPFMNTATSSVSITSRIRSCRSVIALLRCGFQLVDRSVRQWLGERGVDEAVLLDERQAVEALAADGHLEVVAAARPVDDVQLSRVGKSPPEHLCQPLRDHGAHRSDETTADRLRGSLTPGG